MTITLEAQPLTRDAFAPFGQVVETDGAQHFAINQGTTKRFHDLAHFDVGDDGQTLISIFRARPRPQPIALDLMERHPLGSQAFYPLADHDWLVVVSTGEDPLDPEHLRAFRAGGRQGICYAPGTWHHPLLVLKPDHEFLVIDRGGPGDNLEEHMFATRITLAL